MLDLRQNQQLVSPRLNTYMPAACMEQLPLKCYKPAYTVAWGICFEMSLHLTTAAPAVPGLSAW